MHNLKKETDVKIPLQPQETSVEEKDEVKTDSEAQESDCCKALREKTNTLSVQMSELSIKIDDLQLHNKPEHIEAALYNFSRELDNQLASLKAIQNLQSEEFQQKILEKDEMRLQLLENLKKQEQSHLQEMEQLKVQLEAKDKQCLELEQQIENYKNNNDINSACPICFEPWNSSTNHRLASLRCGHLFGDSCLRNCLQRLAECPQCRCTASSHDIRYLYGRPL